MSSSIHHSGFWMNTREPQEEYWEESSPAAPGMGPLCPRSLRVLSCSLFPPPHWAHGSKAWTWPLYHAVAGSSLAREVRGQMDTELLCLPITQLPGRQSSVGCNFCLGVTFSLSASMKSQCHVCMALNVTFHSWVDASKTFVCWDPPRTSLSIFSLITFYKSVHL